MPIEIKELHIRVAVNTPKTEQPAGGRTTDSGRSPAAVADDEKEAIVAACVEQVLQIIQNKAER